MVWQRVDQRSAPSIVELAEHVVEEQHRLVSENLRHDLVRAQSERQGEGSLLPLGGVRPAEAARDPQLPLVSVGSDERLLALQLPTLAMLQRCPQRVLHIVFIWLVGSPVGFVVAFDVALSGCEALVRDANRGCEPSQEPEASADELRSGADELVVEDLKRHARLGVSDPASQERVAVTQDTFVLCPNGGVPGGGGRQQFVEVRSSLSWCALDQLEVIGGKDGYAQAVEEFTGSGERAAIDQDAVSTSKLGVRRQFGGACPQAGRRRG